MWSLSSEEEILRKFANKLVETDSEVYDSKFIKIYNELKKHFGISQAMKAGSLGKGTKIELYGDMDLIFTIDKPESSQDQEMREIVEEKMKLSFGKDNVELKSRSVLVEFKGDFSVDVVYLNKNEFEKEKKQIRHIKTISNEIRNIIILAKYVKYEKNLVKMKSYKIEWNAIYSSAKTFESRLRDTINQSGGVSQISLLYNFILQNAGKKR